MNRKRGTHLCLEGWYYVVVMGFLLAGSLLREINLLVLLVGLMLGALLVSWQLASVSLRQVSVQRTLPKSLGAGDRLVVELEVKNGRRRGTSWALVLEDQLKRLTGRRPAAAAAPSFITRLPAGASERCFYEGRLYERGRYQVGPVRISTRFPLGLVRGWARIDETAQLTVYPKLGVLLPAWHKRQQKAYHGSQTVKRRQGLLEGDFHSMRDYRAGDSQRWIHWRTTARRGELMVRQFEQQQHHDLALLLDLWQPPQADEAAMDNVELAVSFAATVVSDHCRRGASQLLLAIGGKRVEFSYGSASRVLLEEMMEQLAVAEAWPEDQLPELVRDALSLTSQQSDLVIVSTRGNNLADTDRFHEVWDAPRKRSWLTRALCLNAGDEEIDKYFRPQELMV